MFYETQFILSLYLTWLIEIPLLLFLTRFIIRNSYLSTARIACTGLLASALTLPYLWFVLPPYLNAAYYLPIGEFFVIAIEAVIFFLLLRVKPVTAFFLSAVINISSCGIGLLLA